MNFHSLQQIAKQFYIELVGYIMNKKCSYLESVKWEKKIVFLSAFSPSAAHPHFYVLRQASAAHDPRSDMLGTPERVASSHEVPNS